jgi:multidrug efflux pump subunit AcrB
VLRHDRLTFGVALATIVSAGLLYWVIPKGFFPTQDTGIVQVITQAPEATSFSEMVLRQQAVARVAIADPAVETLSSFVGIDGTNTTLNSGRLQINLKPRSERDGSASDVILRLRAKMKAVQGISTYLQPVQDLTVEDRVSRTQFQYTLEDPDAVELTTWTSKLVAELKKLPQLQDVVTDQQPNGNSLALDIDRVTASRLGVTPQSLDDTLDDAFGQRQVATLYTQTHQYHVILEVEPQFRSSLRGLETYVTFDRLTAARLAVTPSDIDNVLNYEFSQAEPSTIYKTLNQYHVVLEAMPELTSNPHALDEVYVQTSSGSVPLAAVATYAPRTGPLSVNRAARLFHCCLLRRPWKRRGAAQHVVRRELALG